MRFTAEALQAAGRTAEDAEQFNRFLNSLSAMRVDRLEISETDVRSKVSWKFHVQHQVFVHRLCDLAEPAVQTWMDGRTLAAVILGRSLVETVAVLHVFVRKTQRLVEARDLTQLDDWVMTLLFGGRYDAWGADYRAVSVMSAIDQLGKELEGIRDHYETISEMVHPNSQGMGQFFSDITTMPEYVDFAGRKRVRAEVLPSLAVSISVAGWAVNLLKALEEKLPEIAKL